LHCTHQADTFAWPLSLTRRNRRDAWSAEALRRVNATTPAPPIVQLPVAQG